MTNPSTELGDRPVYPDPVIPNPCKTRPIDLKSIINAIPIMGDFNEYCDIVLDQVCSKMDIQSRDRPIVRI